MQSPPPTSPKPSSRQDLILIAAGIIIFILIFGELWRRISQASDLRSLEQHIGAQVTELAQESDRMNTLIANAQSDSEVERWARGEGRMVLPSEVLVQPIAPTMAAPTEEPTSAPVQNPPNWRVWWEWLFGQE